MSQLGSSTDADSNNCIEDTMIGNCNDVQNLNKFILQNNISHVE